jgi:hypothetical protein
MKNLLLFSMTIVFMVACSNKKDTTVRATTTGVSGTRNPVNTATLTNVCTQNQFPIGTIYDSGSQQASLYNNGSYEDRVKSFLSATVSPQEVGQISSAQWESTGVRFQGVIKLDTNGNVVVAQSKIIIKVYDSLLFQSSSAQPIPVSIDTASEGKFNMSTGAGYVVFKDQYGEVRLDGNFDAQNFSGTVSYKNYVAFDGSTPAQGQLGQFLIARCAIFQ